MEKSTKAFSSYRYMISFNHVDMAIFTHNYRGECERLEFLLIGKEFDPPFGMMHDFIHSEAGEPLALTQQACDYLKEELNLH